MFSEPSRSLATPSRSAPDGVILCDTSWLMHRAFHAFKGQCSVMLPSNGELIRKDTSVMFGILRGLTSMLKRSPTKSIVFCIDAPLDSLERKKLAPEYKANREDNSQVYSDLNEILRMVTSIRGVYLAYKEGMEADDHIFSLASKLHTHFSTIWVFGIDNDLMQAYQFGNVEFFSKMDNEGGYVFTPRSYYKEKWGDVPYDRLAFYRSFTGDSSDNLKGYPRFPRDVLLNIVKSCSNPEDFFACRHQFRIPARFQTMIAADPHLLEKNFSVMQLKEMSGLNIGKHDKADRSLLIKYKLASAMKELQELGLWS